jgi:protein TIF31
MARHLPNQDQTAPRALRNAHDGPHTLPRYHVKKLTRVDLNGRASARSPPVHHRDAKLGPDSVLEVKEDPYTEKEARLHVIRVRELIGAAGDRTDALHGIMAGLSLHDTVGLDQLAKAKEDGPEPSPLADYDFKAPGAIQVLLPPQQDPAPKCIKSIALSAWNPPPYHLRTKGHLLYLVATTNENEQHHITSHVTGFYVNKSSNASFDPAPRQGPKAHHTHSLLTLLEQLSPSFDASFQQLLEHNAKKELLTIFQLSNAIPANPWLVPPPTSSHTTHQPDLARTQESYLISGVENTDTLRDWNEEFQSTREMPKEAVHDRVFRERLTSKLFADYNEQRMRRFSCTTTSSTLSVRMALAHSEPRVATRLLA